MKSTAKDLSLPELFARFPDESAAIGYLEELRWDGKIECPLCGNKNQKKFWVVTPNKSAKVRIGLRHCAKCDRQFRVTVGTIFERSHIKLNIWLTAWYLICGAKKGISALQLKRILGLGSYKTAWFMCHRIRHAMIEDFFPEKMKGTVEVDECYFGIKGRKQNKVMKTDKLKRYPKSSVIALVDRATGTRRSVVLNQFTAEGLRGAIREHVEKGSTLNTDEHPSYRVLAETGEYKHKAVMHCVKEYHRIEKGGEVVTTNYAESSFALLRRGVSGSFHYISRKHLPKYVAEFDFRWNTRTQTDGERMTVGLKRTSGKRLTMKTLVSDLP